MKSLTWNGRPAKVRSASVWSVCLGTILLAFLLCVPAFAQAPGAAGAATSAADIHTVLVFPFDNAAGDAGAAAANQLADAVKLRLNAVGVYQATTFSVHLPAIERGLYVDNTLSPDDVKGPITDPDQARRLARLAGTDGFVLGSLESLSTQDNGNVRATVSAQLYLTQTKDNTQAGALKTIAITGTAAPSGRSEDPAAVLDRALQDAAGQVASGLTNGATPVRAAVVPSGGGGGHSKISATGALLLALAVGLVIVVATNAGATGGSNNSAGNSGGGTTSGGGGGGGGSGPPGPPFSVHHAH
jgi:hypothetical protein